MYYPFRKHGFPEVTEDWRELGRRIRGKLRQGNGLRLPFHAFAGFPDGFSAGFLSSSARAGRLRRFLWIRGSSCLVRGCVKSLWCLEWCAFEPLARAWWVIQIESFVCSYIFLRLVIPGFDRYPPLKFRGLSLSPKRCSLPFYSFRRVFLEIKRNGKYGSC